MIIFFFWNFYRLIILLFLSPVFSIPPGSYYQSTETKLIDYHGRFLSQDNTSIFDWCCFYFSLEVTNTSSVSLDIIGGYNHFKIWVDGELQASILVTNDERTIFEIASNLSLNQTHIIRIQKMTEASYFLFKPLMWLDKVIFYGVLLNEGGKLLPFSKKANQRKIEFFGDSDTNGFGIVGPNEFTCIFHMVDYEDCTMGYSALLAEYFQADYHIEAWSGKGVVKNAASLFRISDDPMPLTWNRTIATEANTIWNFTSWQPDLVIVYLGTNDYNNEPFPETDYFQSQYKQLLQTIVNSYSTQKSLVLVSLCGGIDQTFCSYLEPAVNDFSKIYPNSYYIHIPQDLLHYPEDFGCWDHRNVKGQTKLFEYLAPKISDIMNWT